MKARITVACAAIFLSACGGGGGSGSSDSSTSGGIDYASKYVGTWKSNCFITSIYKDTSNSNAFAYVTRTFVISKSSNTKLSSLTTDTVYGSTDTTCTGSVFATITKTGQNTGAFTLSNSTKTITSSLGETSLTYAGAANIAGASGAENFDVVEASLYTSSNATLTVGNIQLSTADVVGGSAKNAIYLNGTTLQLGQSTGNTSYPTALNSTPSAIFTKQ